MPGESLDVNIDLPNPEYVAGHLRVGSNFIISEGTHDVGEGTITGLPEKQ